MHTTTKKTTSTEGATMRQTTGPTTVRGRRSRQGAVAAFAVAAFAVAGSTGSVAHAADPVFDLVPSGTWVKALDAAGNEVTQAGGRLDRLQIRAEGPSIPVTYVPLAPFRDVDVTLPEGLQGNPQAAARCSPGVYTQGAFRCPAASRVGSLSWMSITSRGSMTVVEDLPIINVEPPEGVVARFMLDAFGAGSMPVDMRLNSDGSYRIVSETRGIHQGQQVVWFKVDIWGVPSDKNGSGAPRVPLLTMGSECGRELSSTIRARSWLEPENWVEAFPTMPALTGCDRLQFQPKLDLRPLSDVADAPSGYRVKLTVPQSQDPVGTGTPPLKRAEILFPEGTAISPGGANGLASCSDAQAQIGVDASPSCPVASRVGSVQIDTPVLDVPMKGGVFVAEPKSQDAQSGEMFRVFLLASAKGVDIKQEGKLYPDPVTGRLKAVFDNAAKQPFETLTVEMDGGPGAALVNPPTCGTKTTTATLTSWGGQTVTSDSSFDIACRSGLGGFTPSLLAGSRNLLAGVSSPFNLSVTKPDGQSALSGLSLKLPKGLLANLKGNLGTQVGSVKTLAGSGASPFALNGTVTLEGPYGDAPFSLKVVVPAKAGPYDLGDVVVRQKLFVDPETAQVTVVSDPIPTILQGVPTRIQRLDVSVDKPGFMINPTTCEAQSVGGALNAITGQSAAVNVRFQVGGCADLGYAPKLALKVGGELKNGGHPQLDASLTPRTGDANHRSAQVTLPLNLALDPQNAKALCEPAAAAKNACPAESIVGTTKAVSILDVPLEGPVYFVRGERRTATGRVVATLPTLFIPLKGQGVQVNLRASSNVVDRKLQTTFSNLPDAPIESFALKLNGGANGILKVTNGDVCKSTSTPKVGQRMVGQNGKVFRSSSTLATGCRFGVVKTARKGNRVTVTAGGLTGGRVTVSGKGIESNRRTISSASSVASVGVSLNGASRAAVREGRTLRLRVKTSFKPAKKGAKPVSKTTTVVVKPAARR